MLIHRANFKKTGYWCEVCSCQFSRDNEEAYLFFVNESEQTDEYPNLKSGINPLTVRMCCSKPECIDRGKALNARGFLLDDISWHSYGNSVRRKP